MLNELAERCEKATGPDRELDAAIAKALGLPHGRETGWSNSENGDYWVVDECAKPFTASLDAAMMLVPEGWEWSLENTGGETFGPFVAKFGQLRDVEAKTLPLAICAAALRASSKGAIPMTNGQANQTGALKPCACGGHVVFRSSHTGEDTMAVWLQCLGCGAKGGEAEAEYVDYQTAKSLWNTRTEQSQ